MVDTVEHKTRKYLSLHNDRRTTRTVVACTAACALEGFKKSVSPFIGSIDKKLRKYKFTAAIRDFSVKFYIHRLAPYVESMLIKLLGPGLIKVRRGGLSHKSIINTKAKHLHIVFVGRVQ
jgi:hypothetical protein